MSVLDRVVKTWMIQVANGRPYVFQPDGAPTHISYLDQNLLDENVDMFWSVKKFPAGRDMGTNLTLRKIFQQEGGVTT